MPPDEVTKLSRIYDLLLANLEDLGKFDLWGAERQQAIQLIDDAVEEAMAVKQEAAQ